MKKRTPEELADKIVLLLSLLDSNLKDSARHYAERFSWKVCFERQLALYRELALTPNY